MDETLNDCVIGNGTIVYTMGNEASESQANSRREHFERNFDSASQNQVIVSNSDDKIKNTEESAVIVVQIRMHDAISTAMNKMAA